MTLERMLRRLRFEFHADVRPELRRRQFYAGPAQARRLKERTATKRRQQREARRKHVG